MRVLVIVKANAESEAGAMLMGEGLHLRSKGACVRFEGNRHTVIDGPFAETKELIAWFWLWQVRSLEEAIDPRAGSPSALEDRQGLNAVAAAACATARSPKPVK